jgi:hypothetical protein
VSPDGCCAATALNVLDVTAKLRRKEFRTLVGNLAICKGSFIMLDYFGIFTKGGALLWTLQVTALKHNPVEAINALIRTCLLDEKQGERVFEFQPRGGASQSVKWSFDNVRH